MVASTWLGDHHGRPSASAMSRVTAIDLWRVTSRVIIIIIVIKQVKECRVCEDILISYSRAFTLMPRQYVPFVLVV